MPTRTYTNADGVRVTEPIPPRPKVDPVAALRAWARLIRGVVEEEEQEP